MNEKGQFAAAKKQIYWMVISVVLTMVVFGFVALLGAYKSKMQHIPPELPAELISLRFTSWCFGGDEPRLSEFDLSKFTNERLLHCYPRKDKKYFNFKLDLDKSKKSIRTTEFYDGTIQKTVVKPVVVLANGTMYEDNLFIYIQEKFR